MHVVTFYSFKGGVGRTMAMVNVAAELARTGRRVLLVDFDLEAPGLCEFGLLESNIETPGLVEFVTDYLVDYTVPDVSEYLHLSTRFAETSDRLWVMPAGCQRNSSYQALFNSINWKELYSEHNGYLLMEDLRSQWKQAVNPDYVFIDSRTGYTDIAGICTRQLPDAVCLLFTLNKQNLTGLTRITSEIKSQQTSDGLRHPLLHYVASNIPNLDDEENVIANALSNFSEQLAYVKPTAIIHHHDSLALVNEAIFTLQFPKSVLSNQYRVLADEISKQNYLDKQTAISYISTLTRDYVANPEEFDISESERKISLIASNFPNDKEVLFAVSRLRRILGNIEESKILLDLAIKLGLNTSQAFLERIMLRLNDPDRDSEEIWNDMNRILSMKTGVSVGDLLWTVRVARTLGKFDAASFASSPAVKGLDTPDLIYFAGKLEDSDAGLNLMLKLMHSVLSDKVLNIEQMNSALSFISLAYIYKGELQSAIDSMLKITTSDISIVSMGLAFNIGMAKFWIGHPDAEAYLRRVLELYSQDSKRDDVNKLQCISFANWACGNLLEALQKLAEARRVLADHSGQNFSCWRYVEVGNKFFEADLDEMERLYKGEKLSPRFVSGHSSRLFS